jgi:hypothetical protein
MRLLVIMYCLGLYFSYLLLLVGKSVRQKRIHLASSGQTWRGTFHRDGESTWHKASSTLQEALWLKKAREHKIHIWLVLRVCTQSYLEQQADTYGLFRSSTRIFSGFETNPAEEKGDDSPPLAVEPSRPMCLSTCSPTFLYSVCHKIIQVNMNLFFCFVLIEYKKKIFLAYP